MVFITFTLFYLFIVIWTRKKLYFNGVISAEKSTATTDLVVPRTAILWTGKRSVVYVKVPNAEVPSFEMREVTLGNRLGENYQITAGLEAGEEIVSQGAFAVDASAQLSGKKSMMSPSESQGEKSKAKPSSSHAH